MLTYDGERFWCGPTSELMFDEIVSKGGRQAEIYKKLKAIADKYGDERRTEIIEMEGEFLFVMAISDGSALCVTASVSADLGFIPLERAAELLALLQGLPEQPFCLRQFVPLAQKLAKVAINLMEPQAPDSLVAWGFFNAIFEQKEYGEHYVLETLAREMMEQDPALAEEFQKRLATDAEFAASPAARLEFFYKRSPYWDQQMNLYPVGRITSPAHLTSA